ncbi:sigma 54-interacting transcriptional regulator [Heyndrickxia sp. FSL K6-6286]|jgi:PAS domain S-box-containing protein|uniref:sigma-54 interaction domain-containing protein n=1 Tax=Heyndrickxia sp. FSL K6-6286 TaxID=2921510 RepID=UPI00217DB3F5|nr:sigma 54-interacting transcriptional regulator [Heyndrickxia oleronia]
MLEQDKCYLLNDKVKTILEFISDGVYVVNKDGVTLFVNAAYEELSGFDRRDLLGRYMGDLIREGYISQSVSLMVLEKKESLSIMQKLGGKKDVIVTGRPVWNRNGNIEMVVTSVRDITNLNYLKNHLERHEHISKLNNYRFTYDHLGNQQSQFLFKSNIMKDLVRKVEQVAPFPTSIFIIGPSGAGKEEVANLIHYMSDRRKKPFIKVNCAAIPESLLESELFGYVEGAFTGSKREGKIGLLELADGGTFMLDEIGEMPLSLQVKLLRVLQDKQVQRIGSTQIKTIDVRIISATNQNIEQKMQAGEFREDLFYRLAVVQMEVPPLRARLEDVDLLLDHFFHSFKEQYRVEKELLEETKQILLTYHWPGNIRELKNVLESLIVSIPEIIIKPENLPRHITQISNNTSSRTLKEQVENYEKMIIEKSLKRNQSIRKAAKELGVHHTTLLKKLHKWGGNG